MMNRAHFLAVAFAVVVANTAFGQVINPKGGINANRYAQSPWFGEPGIRQQLKLTDEQYARLNQGYASAYKTFNESTADLANLSEQQRQDRLNQNYNTFYKSLDTAGQDVLTPNSADGTTSFGCSIAVMTLCSIRR